MSPDTFRWVRGLRWGPKSSVCPSKPGKSNFLAGYPEILLGYPGGRPKSLRKEFVFNFWPLFSLDFVSCCWDLGPGVCPGGRQDAENSLPVVHICGCTLIGQKLKGSFYQESAKGAGGKGARVINCHNFFFTPDRETRRIDTTTTEGTAERKMRQFATPAPFTPAPFRPF